MAVRYTAVAAALVCLLAHTAAAPLPAADGAVADAGGQAASATRQVVAEWAACGGLHGPGETDDATVGCPNDYTCVRLDEYYWQCRENKSLRPDTGKPKPPAKNAVNHAANHGRNVATTWAQCGGLIGHPKHEDAVWPDMLCPDGYECVRQDQWYYQCKSLQSLNRPDDAAAKAKAEAQQQQQQPQEQQPQQQQPQEQQPQEQPKPQEQQSKPQEQPNTQPKEQPKAKDEEPVKLGLSFPGVTAEEFKDKYAPAARGAVAAIAGVPPSDVKETIKPAAAAPAAAPGGSARRLLQQAAGVEVTYEIKSADRASTLERLELATANDAAPINAALAAAGVPLRPGVSIEGTRRIAAPPAPRVAAKPVASPKSPAAANKGVIIGAVVGALGGALLLALLALLIVFLVRRRAQAQSTSAKKGADLEMGRTNVVAEGTGRIVVEPMAPAEAFPRSFPMDVARPAPVRTSSRKAASPAPAAADSDDEIPLTPGSHGPAESFKSGEEQFATPRSAAGSDASFKSARAGPSEASFKSAQGGGPASVASFATVKSNQSRGTALTSASRHESAVEFPQAFVPAVADVPSSDEGSAERLPAVAAPRPPAPASRLSGKAPSKASGSTRRR